MRTIINEKRKYTKELQEATKEEKNINKKLDMSTHFNICYSFVVIHPEIQTNILQHINNFDYIQLQQKQIQFIDSMFSPTKTITNLFKGDMLYPIEELLLLDNYEEAYRQLCMLSVGNDGLKPEIFDEIKRFFIHYKGIHETNMFAKLEMSGLLKKSTDNRKSYSNINSAMKIFDEKDATLYSGYTPFLCKSLEYLINPNLEADERQNTMISKVVKNVQQVISKTINEVLYDEEQLVLTNVKGRIEGTPKKIVLFVIGGISLGEIASLKLMAQRLGRPIIIGSTHIIRRNNNMINQFIKSVQRDMDVL